MSEVESFYGFDLRDAEIGPGPQCAIALELKHVFEGLLQDADERNEEIFMPSQLISRLRSLFQAPSSFTLATLLSVSPASYEPVVEITRLVSPTLLNELPVVC